MELQNFKLKGLLYVHNAIRRDVMCFNNLFLTKSDFEKLKINKLALWFNNYSDMLHIHHSSENNVFFPALIKKSPDLENLIIKLENEHIELDQIIDDIKYYLKNYKKEYYDNLKNLSTKLLNHLFNHAAEEEKYLIPATALYLTIIEQRKLESKLQRHISLTKVSFLISWIMYELPVDYKDEFYNSLPIPFRFLYQTRWKSKFSKYQKSFI